MRKFFDPKGEISSLDLFAALCDVGREGKSATVHFSRGLEAISLHFRDGVLSGLEAPEALSPGTILVRSGKIQRATFDGLIVPEGEDRFAVAVTSGVVSRKEAFWGRKIAAIEALSRLLTWSDGEYEYDETPPAEEAGGFRLPIDKWILELFLRSNDRPLVMHQLGPTDLPLVKADYFASAFAALGLTADADAVAGSIDGKRTIEQIVRRAPAEEFAVLKLLAALVTLGLVRPALEDPFPSVSNPALELPAEAPETSEEFPEPDLEPVESLSAIEETPAPQVPPETFVEEVFDPSEPPAPIALPEEAVPVLEDVVSVPLFALTAPESSEGEAFTRESPAEDDSSNSPAPPRSRVAGAATLVAVLLLAAAGGFYWKTRSGRSGVSSPQSQATVTSVAEKHQPPPVPTRTVPQSPRSSALREVEPNKAPSEPKKAPPPRALPPARREERQPARPAARTAAPWKSRLAEGQREFERPGIYRYAVQLELACEESTVEKALARDSPSQKIWVAPKEFRGRSCYRVLWGRFKTIEAARAAREQVPAFFTQGNNRPAVVSLGSSEKASGR